MNEFSTYEIISHQKSEGRFLIRKLLLLLFYIAFVCGWLVLGVITRIFVPLMALIPLTTWILVFLTWKYTNIDYECSMTSGIITFSKIYGGRSRRMVFEIPIKSIELIAPYNDDYLPSAERYMPKVQYSALSTWKYDSPYFALFENKRGERSIFIFEADEKSLKICRFYNPAATRTK